MNESNGDEYPEVEPDRRDKQAGRAVRRPGANGVRGDHREAGRLQRGKDGRDRHGPQRGPACSHNEGLRGKGGEIKIACRHDAWGKLVIVIVDSGAPLNILLSDAVFPGEEPTGDATLRASARLIKRLIDNIEYKRVDNENTLSFFVSGELRAR